MRTWIAIAALFAIPAMASDFSPIRRAVQLEGTPQSTACATLDADLFHRAAPALRDLRLRNGETELPYAIDESYDEHSLQQGITFADDRSFYDTVATSTATQEGDALVFRFTLPSHVPVTRIHLNEPVKQNTAIEVAAKIDGGTEEVHGTISRGGAVFPVTLGANLQEDAKVTVWIRNSGLLASTSLSLEMRRRWICFPALSADNVWLYIGGPSDRAPNYAYARSFRMPQQPQVAHLLPAQPYSIQEPQPLRNRTLLAAGIALAGTTLLCLLGALWLYTQQKKIPKN